MAVCKWCDQEMTDRANVRSCTQDSVEYPDGEVLNPVPYTHWAGRYHPGTGETSPREEIPEGHRCHDCGIERGGVHHPGCDMERCPRCGGQLIGCGCLDEEEEE